MITAEQIRSSRAALGWSAEDLANECGIARRTIVSIEAGSGIPSANAQTLHKITIAFEAAGIEFIGSPGDGPGIRIRNPGG